MSTHQQLPPHALRDIRVLVVDDEDILAWSIDTELKSLGADVLRAASVREALERFPSFAPDLTITDLRLPDGSGLELLKKWHFEHPEMPVILITAHGAIDSAITALRLGAFDYLQKPFDMKDLIAAVRRASEMAKLRQKVSSMQGRELHRADVDIVGDAPSVVALREQLRRIARSRANIALILGESGTGKELAARAIHQWSDRHSQPFVEINCASIPETLLESELFGYERGAFTDARDRKLGLFETARAGSIFLDEIGEMPVKLQAKLLRVLEYRRFKRLGGTKDIEFTGRIIAATNRNLLEEVAEKRFRADLYYRLNVLPVRVPTLRERRQDIGPLTEFLLGKLAEELELKVPAISSLALQKLHSHSWPGNIRELKNVLQRALVFHEPSILEAEDLELDDVPESVLNRELKIAYDANRSKIVSYDVVHGTSSTLTAATQAYDGLSHFDQGPNPSATNMPVGASSQSSLGTSPLHGALSERANLGGELVDQRKEPFKLPESGISLEDLEKSLLEQALDRARNNQTRAAQLLGISRHTLRYRLEKHGLVH
jgi:two-component system response regulator AtoC